MRTKLLLVGLLVLAPSFGCRPQSTGTGTVASIGDVARASVKRGGIIPPPCLKVNDGQFTYETHTITAWGNTVPKIGFIDMATEDWVEFDLSQTSVTIWVNTCK